MTQQPQIEPPKSVVPGIRSWAKWSAGIVVALTLLEQVMDVLPEPWRHYAVVAIRVATALGIYTAANEGPGRTSPRVKVDS